jgi:hypothetical protein
MPPACQHRLFERPAFADMRCYEPAAAKVSGASKILSGGTKTIAPDGHAQHEGWLRNAIWIMKEKATLGAKPYQLLTSGPE